MATKGLTDLTTNTKPKKQTTAAGIAQTTNPGGVGKAQLTQYGSPVSQAAAGTPIKAAAVTTTPAGYSQSNPSSAGVPGWNQGNTDPITGAIANYGYTPTGLGTIYDNPTSIANDVLASLGINNVALGNMVGQQVDPAVAAQFILNGGRSASDADTMNFVNQYLTGMNTPNGRSVQFDKLIGDILGSTSNPNNALGAYLTNSSDPASQVQAENALLSQTLTGLNPYAQNAYYAAIKNAGNQYQTALAKGNPQGYTSYNDYLATATPLRLWAGV